MPGRKEKTPAFLPATVLLRADICNRAREENIDISDTCNSALAALLGIDYRQQRLDDVPVPAPVIVAKDGAAPVPGVHGHPRAAPQPPVINADAPKAAGVIAKGRKQAPKKPVPELAPVPLPAAPAPVRPAPAPAATKAAAKPPKGPAGKSAAKKPAKADLLKTFIAAHIVRADDGDAGIQKEELYELFSRWCRDLKQTAPDSRSVAVALKTRFAFRDRVIGGVPCWANVRLK
jgi:hypothetical protein